MGKEFNKVYDNNKKAVYGYLYYMTKDAEDAKDLSQDTFLKIYQNLKSFKGDSNERSWCITIARNTFLSWIRKKKPNIADGEDIEQLPSVSDSNPETILLQQEIKKSIKDVMLLLKEEYRTILLLRDYEDMSYKEIGIVTGLSESAVKIRIFRAREQYRKLYNQYQSIGR